MASWLVGGLNAAGRVFLTIFENFEALACLPFLIGIFAGSGIEEVVVVGCRGFCLVKRIVGDGPEEVSGGDLREIL